MPQPRPLARCAAALALVALLGPGGAPAQDLPTLLTLGGEPAWVRYTPGSLDRAARVQGWLRLLAEDAAGWSKRPLTLGAFLLERREWEEQGLARAFGLPLVAGIGQVALPAWGDDGTVALWRDLAGPLPAVADPPVRGTVQEAASVAAADRLAAFELARTLVRPLGLRPDEAWLEDLLAHLLLRSALARAGLASAFPAPPVDSEWPAYRDGMPFTDWLAFQARLAEGAEILAAAEPRRTMTRLLDLQRRQGALTGEALTRKYRPFAAWLATTPMGGAGDPPAP